MIWRYMIGSKRKSQQASSAVHHSARNSVSAHHNFIGHDVALYFNSEQRLADDDGRATTDGVRAVMVDGGRRVALYTSYPFRFNPVRRSVDHSLMPPSAHVSTSLADASNKLGNPPPAWASCPTSLSLTPDCPASAVCCLESLPGFLFLSPVQICSDLTRRESARQTRLGSGRGPAGVRSTRISVRINTAHTQAQETRIPSKRSEGL